MWQALAAAGGQGLLTGLGAHHLGIAGVMPVSSGNPGDKLGGPGPDGPKELTESSVTADFA